MKHLQMKGYLEEKFIGQVEILKIIFITYPAIHILRQTGIWGTEHEILLGLPEANLK